MGGGDGSIRSVGFSAGLASIIARTSAITVIDARVDGHTVLVSVRL